MGVYNAELFTNLGLCCFFAQQYDMTLNCFERALALASDENMADVWYNIGHVAVVNNVSLKNHCSHLHQRREYHPRRFSRLCRVSRPSLKRDGTGF